MRIRDTINGHSCLARLQPSFNLWSAPGIAQGTRIGDGRGSGSWTGDAVFRLKGARELKSPLLLGRHVEAANVLVGVKALRKGGKTSGSHE